MASIYKRVDTLATPLLLFGRSRHMRKSTGGVPAVVRRILLVDDSIDGLKARKAVLEAEGHKVTACLSATEALEHMRNDEYSLFITDFQRFDMDGAKLIRAVRQLRPDIKAVLISGMVEVMGLTEQNTGADAVIAKNNNEVPTMVRVVNRLLHVRKPAASQKRAASVRSRKLGS